MASVKKDHVLLAAILAASLAFGVLSDVSRYRSWVAGVFFAMGFLILGLLAIRTPHRQVSAVEPRLAVWEHLSAALALVLLGSDLLWPGYGLTWVAGTLIAWPVAVKYWSRRNASKVGSWLW